jgi:hypothetical protein
MFLKSSRYYKQKLVETEVKKEYTVNTVKAVKLRRLSDEQGNPAVVKGNDRLDIISQRQYGNPTMFWHIADANTDLQANNLVSEPGRVILVPGE